MDGPHDSSLPPNLHVKSIVRTASGVLSVLLEVSIWRLHRVSSRVHMSVFRMCVIKFKCFLMDGYEEKVFLVFIKNG